jgi:parallel beta-helix repeat protein
MLVKNVFYMVKKLVKKFRLKKQMLVKKCRQQTFYANFFQITTGNNCMRAAILALTLICLMTLGAVCSRPVKADFSFPFDPTSSAQRLDITINADGGVTSFTKDQDGNVNSSVVAPLQYADNTYNLTDNVEGDITVLRSNTLLNGNGFYVRGEVTVGNWGSQPAYQPVAGLFFISNVTVENFNVYGGKVDKNGVYIAASGFGIQLILASNVTVTNNNVTLAGDIQLSPQGQTSAIDVEGGGSNVIVGNNLERNWLGMVFRETENNLIIENNITSTHNPDYPAAGIAGFGIIFWGSSDNFVYHNHFVKNDVQAYDDALVSSVNVWDSGYPGGGNYWSDYKTKCPNASEIICSKLGNESYIIDSRNKDRYPLMEAFNSTFFELQTTPPKVTINWPVDQTYESSTNVPLLFSVEVFSATKSVDWFGYSLDGQRNVTISGDIALMGLSSGWHKITIYANDTFGNMGTSKTVTFTMLPFPAAAILGISGASIALAVGLFVFFRRRKRKV